jgi:hypothetical protein
MPLAAQDNRNTVQSFRITKMHLLETGWEGVDWIQLAQKDGLL